MTGSADGTGQASTQQAGTQASTDPNKGQQAAAAGDAAAAAGAAAAKGDAGQQQQQQGDATQQGKKEGDDKGTKKDGAPEQYADFTAPEGVKFDDAIMGEFKATAKKLNLSQEAAQELVNLGAKMAGGFNSNIEQTIVKAKAQWATDAKADSEIGGEQFDANLAKANQVFHTFGTPALKELLEKSGLGNHPELVRWAFRVSKEIGEDKLVRGDKGVKPAAKDLETRAAEKLYGT